MSDPLFVGPCAGTYTGPVESSIPGYGVGAVARFCPSCNGTDIAPHRGRFGYRCRTCGRRFRLPPQEDWVHGAVYTVYADGRPIVEGVSASLLRGEVDAVLEEDMADDGYYRDLARDYYGGPCEGCESDLPTIGVNTVFARGYVRGLLAGEYVHIPGTRLTVVRTENTRRRE